MYVSYKDLKSKGLKCCKSCHEIKNLDNFRTIKVRKGVFSNRSVCSVCEPAYIKKYTDDRRQNKYFNYILSLIKNRSKRNKLAFDLTVEYIESLFKTQNGLCVLTGLPMNFDRSSRSNRNPFMASLDRIEPNKGYIQGNVRWVLFSVNLALLNWGENLFSEICVAYLRNRRGSSCM